MVKLAFELNQSLDGYVDHQAFGPPDPALFRHFTERVRGLTGMLYGRGMYEVMRYWDDDRPEWGADEREYAAVWRSKPKWVVSRSLESVGPNATLVADDVEAVIRGLKSELAGEIEVAGPELAQSLGDLVSSTSIGSTSTPSYWVAANLPSQAHGHGFVWWRAM
jgi:dihydrofolate reductase